MQHFNFFAKESSPRWAFLFSLHDVHDATTRLAAAYGLSASLKKGPDARTHIYFVARTRYCPKHVQWLTVDLFFELQDEKGQFEQINTSMV
jgi:hypothetical protein